MTTASEVFNDYLSAFESGDMDRARALVADDFSFEGPMLQVDGKDAFFEAVSGLASIIKGHTILKQFEDGDEVCSIYDFEIETRAGAGSVTMSEWCRVRDGRLTSARLVFDTAAFNALMPA